MFRFATIIPVGLLLACSPVAPDQTPSSLGEVRYGGETYAIRIHPPDPAAWQVMVEGMPVNCRRPTSGDCYWSLRNRLATQEALDDLP